MGTDQTDEPAGAPSSRPPKSRGCPSDEELGRYLDGQADPDLRARIQRHADGCEGCRAALGAFFEAYGSDDPPPLSAPSLDLAPGTRIGRYAIVERLGAGGMGVVYSARDVELGRLVALKLLAGRATAHQKGDDGSERTVAGQARLQREARMMARLGHPNVVAVFETGLAGEEVFVAMELVDGQNLRAWLEGGRSVDATLGVFHQAALGLMAAHEAGIVHRDVKPENILVGRDGRVRITDFGLARPELANEPAPGFNDNANVLSSLRTRVGALVGTPAYMALEQLEGKPVDARSDQFSFAIALFEALFGERPYAGANPHALRESMRARALRPGRRKGVPTRVRNALRRALDPDPEQRFPTLAPLAEALSAPRRELRLALALLVLILATIPIGLLGRRPAAAPPNPCPDTPDPLAGIWDAPTKKQVAEHLRATAPAIAAEVLLRLEPALDAHATAIRTMRVTACRATRVTGEQSEALLDLRMQCLDQRKEELRAIVALLGRADAKTAVQAPRAVLGLTDVLGCADVVNLSTPVPLPKGSGRSEIEAIRIELTNGEVAYLAARYPEGLAIAIRAALRAQAVGYRPVQAEALFLRGRLELSLGSFAAARDTFLEAVSRAEAGKHDALAAEIWAWLTLTAGSKLEKHDESRLYEARARAAIERAGQPIRARLALALALGTTRRARGEYAAAVPVLDEALGIATHDEAFVPERVELLAELARAHRQLAAYPAAEDAIRRALVLAEARFGPSHPDVASLIEVRAMIASMRGDHAASIDAYAKVVAVRTKALGDQHPDVAQAQANLAMAYVRAGRPLEAIPLLEKVLAIEVASYGAAHANIGQIENNLGLAYLRAGDFTKARVHCERAVAQGEKALGPKHPRLAVWLQNLAKVEIKEGAPKLAIPLLERALSIEESALGQKHPDLAFDLTDLGEAHLALGDAKKARPLLERAVALRTGSSVAKQRLAESQFMLARALLGEDDARARALAREAEKTFADAGPGAKGDHAAVVAWLAEHDAAKKTP
ncbi:MAG: tetratricopeptide repeat protein [Myxococcales bacterium]|nr:tetratricopeptide repeat protein [Myxococcales bacterium]